MNSQQKPTGVNPAADAGADNGNPKTPATDMQPEDAGTPESGNTGNAGETATKPIGKTGNEKSTNTRRS